jgi:hypothetical protein
MIFLKLICYNCKTYLRVGADPEDPVEVEDEDEDPEDPPL